MNFTQLVLKSGLILSLLLLQPLVETGLVSYAAKLKNSAEIEGNIDDVARAILTYFPKVKGKVIAFTGEEIEIDLGGKRGLSKGTLLTVFRKNETFYHPVTGVPLGQFEETVGILEVHRFAASRLFSRAISPNTGIRVGDLVRITATRIPLSVSLSSDTGQSFLMNELVSALTDTGRFNITSLAPGADLETARAGKNLYHVQLETSRRDDRFSMKLHIQNTFTGTVLAQLSVLIKQSDESDLVLEHLQFQLFEQRQKK